MPQRAITFVQIWSFFSHRASPLLPVEINTEAGDGQDQEDGACMTNHNQAEAAVHLACFNLDHLEMKMRLIPTCGGFGASSQSLLNTVRIEAANDKGGEGTNEQRNAVRRE
jgi:hypothetical protein